MTHFASVRNGMLGWPNSRITWAFSPNAGCSTDTQTSDAITHEIATGVK